MSTILNRLEDQCTKINHKAGKQIITLKAAMIIISILLIMGGTALIHSSFTSYEIQYNGNAIGCVENIETYNEAVAELEQKLEIKEGTSDVQIDGNIQIKPVHAKADLNAFECADIMYKMNNDVDLAQAK